MNKATLADKMHEYLGGTKVQANGAVDFIFDTIVKTLKKEGEVAIAGFGTFRVAKNSRKTARNPKTGEMTKVKYKNKTSFKVSKTVKDIMG